VFDAVEVNSTFYRRHRPATFQRWAASVPADFRFSVKVPRAATHQARLRDCDEILRDFLADLTHLGPKLGPILLQLPPSLPFETALAEPICRLGDEGRRALICEPRHATWFTPEADAWLAERRIARVAADPARHPDAERPGGWRGLSYYRLHGFPRIYYSQYDEAALTALGARFAEDPAPDLWCIFDNTALGHATADAMRLKALLAGRLADGK
jgi:uncharacterized protein YecE (DUF72 family)